jgi:hypothetical protein
MLEWLSYHSADRLIGLSPGIVDGIIGRGIQPERVPQFPMDVIWIFSISRLRYGDQKESIAVI